MSTYRIRSGDTLWALSRKFGTTVDELARLNNIKNPNLIITGRTLQLPGKTDSVDPAPRPPSRPRPDISNRPSRPTTPRPSTPPRRPAPSQGSGTGSTGKVNLASVPRGEAAQYQYFQDLVKQNGGHFKTGPNQFNLVGLRTETRTTTNGGSGSYDDRLAMVWRDAGGKPHVKLLRYNTEPAKNMSAYSSDVNGDGRADQGRIPSGYYEYAKSSWKHGFCLRATRDFRVDRDWNHDGKFSKGEGPQTGGGASMLFHQGGSYSTGSAGCQTFPPSEWARFVSTIRNARGSLGYTLITRSNQGNS